MSQAQNPRDNQALLQSMLQRLKLQAEATNIQSGENTAQDLQTIKNNSNPVNGFEPEGNIKRDFTVNGKTQDNDSSSEGSRASGQDLLSHTGPPLSQKSAQDATTVSSEGGFNFTAFKSVKDTFKGPNIGESAGKNLDQNRSYVPKVYAWSPKSPDIQDNKVLFEGAFGAMGQSTQTVSNNQNTTNNRTQKSAENKTQRWTQKIKEKWRKRPGSFGKKEKDNRSVDTISQRNSSQYLPVTTENLNSPSHKESEGTTSVESPDNSKTVCQTSDGNDEYVRSTNDFDLCLGTYNLLDEIAIGQEWAKFLNPSISASVHERPCVEALDPTLTNHNEESSGINPIPKETENNSWTSRTNRKAQDSDIAMTHVLCEPSLPVSMDIREKYQIHSAPMDQGQSQSFTPVTLVNTVESSSLRGRNSLSRKRQYQSTERIETMFQSLIPNGNDRADDGSVFLPDNHPMDNTDETTVNVSSTPAPCSPVRGVLKATLSCDSSNSMETVSKKRRVEDTRRVRFSEEIITIDPPELGPYDSESEEEEGDEEESLIEDDSEDTAEPVLFGPIQPQHAAPARRPVLPAWIRALKRRNMGKKHR